MSIETYIGGAQSPSSLQFDFSPEARAEKYDLMRQWFINLANARKKLEDEIAQSDKTKKIIAEELKGSRKPDKISYSARNVREKEEQKYIAHDVLKQRATTFEQIQKQAQEWQPQFEVVEDIVQVADMINLPHDDYPLRVNRTIELIQNYIVVPDLTMLTETDLFHIHSTLFAGEGYNHKNIERGAYRRTNVKVGNHYAPEFLFVEHLTRNIVPVVWDVKNASRYVKFVADDEWKMKRWYSLFQCIHPFQDGNGRVGGIVVAIMSHLKTGKFLAPNQ